MVSVILDHRIVDLADDLRDGQPDEDSDGEPAADDAGELDDHARGRHLRARHHVERQREEDDRGAVVEQALALEQDAQPVRRPKALEHPDDRNRVGGGDERSEDHGVPPAKSRSQSEDPGHQVEEHRRQGDRHDHARHGERGNRKTITPEVPKLEVECGLEQQPWQEHGVEEFFGEVRRFEQADEAEHKTGKHQGHGVGEAEPTGGDGDRRGDNEEQDETSGCHRAAGLLDPGIP